MASSALSNEKIGGAESQSPPPETKNNSVILFECNDSTTVVEKIEVEEESTEEEFPHYVLYTDDESTEEFTPYVYDTDEDTGITQEDYDKYCEQCEKSQGFTVESFPSAKNFSRISPLDLSNKFVFGRDIVECAQFAFNEKEGTKYAFDRVIRANGQIVRSILYYITFAAKDANGHEVKFQTRVLATPESLDVELFRTEPTSES